MVRTTKFVNAYFATFLFLNRFSSNMAQNLCMAKARVATKTFFFDVPVPFFDFLFAYNFFVSQPIFFNEGSKFVYCRGECPDEAVF